jgi:hypothetical protein
VKNKREIRLPSLHIIVHAVYAVKMTHASIILSESLMIGRFVMRVAIRPSHHQ